MLKKPIGSPIQSCLIPRVEGSNTDTKTIFLEITNGKFTEQKYYHFLNPILGNIILPYKNGTHIFTLIDAWWDSLC